MKVKLFKNVGGNPEGSIIEVSEQSGQMIIKNGWGQLVSEAKAVQSAPQNKAEKPTKNK